MLKLLVFGYCDNSVREMDDATSVECRRREPSRARASVYHDIAPVAGRLRSMLAAVRAYTSWLRVFLWLETKLC